METLVIDSYSRAQAIHDGVLLDVSELAREVGFRIPVALTETVWTTYIKAPLGHAQNEGGCLWDCLWMLFLKIRAIGRSSPQVMFSVYFNNGSRHELATLKAVCGPGDDLHPVITIMLPDED